jgi:hypothetical protein
MPPQAGPKARTRRCINRAKRTTGAAAPLPRGGIPSENSAPNRRGGYTGGRRRVQRRVRAWATVARRPGPPGLRSLPAKQHAPKARVPTLPPTVAGAPWSRAGGQGRMGSPWEPARRRGAGHSPLTAGQLATTAPPALRRTWWPACRGEGLPLDPPPAAGGAARALRTFASGLAGDVADERNSSPSRRAEQRGEQFVTGCRACLLYCYDPTSDDAHSGALSRGAHPSGR